MVRLSFLKNVLSLSLEKLCLALFFMFSLEFFWEVANLESTNIRILFITIFFLNFAGPKLIDASGLDIPELLEAILKFFPLDTYVFNPVVLMDLVNSDKKKDMEVAIWPKYQKICDEAEGRSIVMYKEER